jgi:hypothetical protein
MLSRMLGVRRSGITVALHMLESRHLIRAKRNFIEILDPQGLTREAAEDCPIDADYGSGSKGAAQPL